MDNPFPHSSDNKRYHTLAYHFRQTFGRRMFKVPVDLGLTCPNRDGSRGTGGCTYCAGGGGGGFGEAGVLPLKAQYLRGLGVMRRKWPDGGAILYLQSYTNTYLPPERLRERLSEALTLPGVEGISVATRADALPPAILDILEEWANKTWLSVELGLQTVHDETARRINRCHTYSEFLEGFHALRERRIPTCVHLINGLPGESPAMMKETAQSVGELRPHSVKFHMLHLVEGTPLAEEYRTGGIPLLTREEYVSILADQLERLPPETVIQRITGDPPAESLIAPDWTRNKLWVRNALDREFARRNSMQGACFRG